MYQIKRSDTEIDEVLNWAAEGLDDGTHYSGMSMEEGITQFATWLFGDTDERPDQ